MPARRLPWFKLWPEAMRHEKIVLLSDGTFRTWIVVLAAGSEQSIRWRFASVKHAVSVTGRPLKHIRDLIAARLIDESEDGELWVHDWRQWQDRYESDFAPRTLPEDSANAPNKLRAEEEEEREEEKETKTPPPTPYPASGEGDAADAAGKKRRGGRRNGVVHDEPTAQPLQEPELAPVNDQDRSVWNLARANAAKSLSNGNAEALGLLEPIGRAADGGLHLRAPPGLGLAKFTNHVARALLDAGDQAASRVAIVEGRPGESKG